MIQTKTFHILKNIKIISVAVLLTKLYVFKINLPNKLFLIEERLQLTDLLKQFLKNMIIAKKL